jgi:hypothetical protein
VDRCRWREPGGVDAARTIARFLEEIGIEIEIGKIDDESLLPGMGVRAGRLRIDPAIPAHPGDMLHEAGHLALCDPAVRATIDDVGDDPGHEMAAIAWSVAAARACGVPLETVFHPDGYRGWSPDLPDIFADGRGFGVPMLAYYGMTAEPHRAEADGLAPFPAMTRWLR